MEQNRYATKKKGKTEVYPFWNMADIKNVVEWFENNNEWLSIDLQERLKSILDNLKHGAKKKLIHLQYYLT